MIGFVRQTLIAVARPMLGPPGLGAWIALGLLAFIATPALARASPPSGSASAFSPAGGSAGSRAPTCGNPRGPIIDPMETVGSWQIGSGNGALAAGLSAAPGCNGQGLRLDYDLGANPGAYAQLRREFSPPLDLSANDHLRLFHCGNRANTLEVGMVSAAGDNYFATPWHRATQVPGCTYATWEFRDFRLNGDRQGEQFPDPGQVAAIFISIVHSPADNDQGGQGYLIVDELQALDLASREVPKLDPLERAKRSVLRRAARWIAARLQPSGLVDAWRGDEDHLAWLYPQALALMVLSETRPGKATALTRALVRLQNDDGSWYDGYDYATAGPLPPAPGKLERDKPVGAIAWTAYALARHVALRGGRRAYRAARKAAELLVQEQREDGSLPPVVGQGGFSTEANLSAWWALRATGKRSSADSLQRLLLESVWDPAMGRFKGAPSDHQIFLDQQTWGAEFLSEVGRRRDARRALSYAQQTLATTSQNREVQGFDGAGPFSVWNEGVLQYIAAGGDRSKYYWKQMVAQQNRRGGLPWSPDSFEGYIVGLQPWDGVVPTAWLYFAGTGGPFEVTRGR